MPDAPGFPFGFIVAEHDARHQRVIAISARGELLRQYACDDLPLDVDLRPDGRLLLTTRRAVVELDPSWNETWRYEIPDVFVAACQWMDGGRRLVADTARAQVYVVDADRQIVRSLDVARTPDLAPAYNLFRNVRQLPNGRVLVACHHDRKVAEYDWDRGLCWHAPVEGTPYQALRVADGHTLVSLGPSGRIVEIDGAGLVVRRYDMTADHGLERGWVAGLTYQPDGTVTYSDSRHDRLVALDWATKELRGIFHDPKLLLHPSTHILLP